MNTVIKLFLLLRKSISTHDDWSSLFLRIGPGIIIGLHMLTNLSGNAAENGLQLGTGNSSGIYLLGLIACICLAFGFLTRLCGVAVAILCVWEIFSLQLYLRFFMLWYPTAPAAHEGIQLHLMALVVCLVLIWSGGGGLSIDRILETEVDWDFIQFRLENRGGDF